MKLKIKEVAKFRKKCVIAYTTEDFSEKNLLLQSDIVFDSESNDSNFSSWGALWWQGKKFNNSKKIFLIFGPIGLHLNKFFFLKIFMKISFRLKIIFSYPG